jgi:hypothetical protein
MADSEADFRAEVTLESRRVCKALRTAFATEGTKLDQVRLCGIISGCLSFLINIVSDLSNWTDGKKSAAVFEATANSFFRECSSQGAEPFGDYEIGPLDSAESSPIPDLPLPLDAKSRAKLLAVLSASYFDKRGGSLDSEELRKLVTLQDEEIKRMRKKIAGLIG